MDIQANIREDQDYEARGIIARIQPCGEMQIGVTFMPLFRFITLDTGKGRPPQCARLVGKAPVVVDDADQEYLDTAAIKEGQIVVSPGLLYEKCEFTGTVYSEHLLQLRNYKPKDILVAEAPSFDEAAIDLPELDFTTDQVTKQ